MKKTLPLIFAFSLTAGTVCLAYVKTKDYKIKRLMESWSEQAKLKQKTLDVPILTAQLEKLNLYDIHLLQLHTKKVFTKATEAEIIDSVKKLHKRKIMQKADLKSLENFILPG